MNPDFLLLPYLGVVLGGLRRFVLHDTDHDRAAWVAQVRSMHDLYREKESSYWERQVSSNAGNSRKLWKSLLCILKRDKEFCAQTFTVSKQSVTVLC